MILRTEIKRFKPVDISDVEEVCMPNVREEAESVLGYRKPTTKDLHQSALMACLAKLEIEVLDWRDVIRYQAEKRCEAITKEAAEYASAVSLPRWKSWSDWTESELSKYSGVIPDHALQKAIEIKRELPEVEFVVESLEHSDDPFLIAIVKKGSYDYDSAYIEVWDEPKFEVR